MVKSGVYLCNKLVVISHYLYPSGIGGGVRVGVR